MSAGLFRLGHDFGNGARDAQHFQRDELAPSYTAAKLEVLARHPGRVAARGAPALHEGVIEWIRDRYRTEHGVELQSAANADSAERYRAITPELQEDFVVLRRDTSGVERVEAVSVCFPSGWRPESLLGHDFRAIHAPVPAFDDVARSAPKLVAAMMERGPYVRFVWTLVADPRLDHHPDDSPRAPFERGGAAWLRVERQLTVPFPALDASLFLIRTYLYGWAELSEAERADVRTALERMPADIARYKGLEHALAALG